MGHLIGKGAFGFVYQGFAKGINTDEKTTTVAIKTVRGKFIFILSTLFHLVYHQMMQHQLKLKIY